MDKLYDKYIPSSSTCYLNLEQINLIEKAISSYINFTEYSFLWVYGLFTYLPTWVFTNLYLFVKMYFFP